MKNDKESFIKLISILLAVEKLFYNEDYVWCERGQTIGGVQRRYRELKEIKKSIIKNL